jgi:hypothetical protein
MQPRPRPLRGPSPRLQQLIRRLKREPGTTVAELVGAGWNESRLGEVLLVLEAASLIQRQRQKGRDGEWHTCIRWVA